MMQPAQSARGRCAFVGLALLSGGLVAAAPASADSTTATVSTHDTALSTTDGTVWDADRGFEGGQRWNTDTGRQITGTSDDALYQNEHYGMAAFRQAVPDGTYDVTLKMAEIYWDSAGRRVFDVAAEQRSVLQDVDIFAEVGKDAALDKSFQVAVTDGVLDLDFRASVDYPKVSAIRIDRVATPTPVPAPAGGKPGAGNTGVPAGTALKPYYGNLNITTPGATYDSLDIHGFVKIMAPNVRITRSIIRGGVATNNIGIVTNYEPTATNFVLEDSELVPEFPSVWIDAIKGANYTIRRVEAHGTNDTVKIHGDNVRVESSWLHDTVWRPFDPNLGGPTHNDGVQVLGGRNIRILGNTITGSDNAGMQVTQDYSATTDLQFNDNWVDGGGCSVNLAHKKLSSMSGITVNDNRFGRNTRIPNCAIISTHATALTASGNVWDDNGQPVDIKNGG